MSHLLAEKFKDFHIILASGSPRRKELLKGLDLDYTIETKEVDEVYPDHLKEQEITEYLARLKADAFGNIDEHTLIITADTIVWHQNKAVMKPVDDADAVAILKKLSGEMHLVYTSVCLRTQQFEKVFSESRILRMSISVIASGVILLILTIIRKKNPDTYGKRNLRMKPKA